MLRGGITILFLFLMQFGFTQESEIGINIPRKVVQGGDTLTNIYGTARGAEGKTIVLSTPGDLITFVNKPLATAKVEANGKFSLTLRTDQTRVAILSINSHKAEIFLEPGKSQRVIIDSINYDDYQEINPFIQSQNLQVRILFEEPYDLNFVIGEFNGMYNAFLLDNFNALYRDKKKALVDTFRLQTQTRFGMVPNSYFKSYAAYKIAALEQLTRYYSAAELARRYFIGKPVLAYNLEYMDFFNSYFSKYLTVTSKVLHLTDYKTILKGVDPYAGMMAKLATDTLLRSEQLRELVLLKGMMEMYNLQGYNQDDILKVIAAVETQSKYSDNRATAGDIVALLTKLKPGTTAPAFSLDNRFKNKISLSDFKGKPVVLSFWTTYCQGCLNEMDLIKPLYDKYKGKVEFVSISADADFNKMVMFINLKKEFVWIFLHVGDQSEVLSNYDVRSYPLFVLIDKEGKIYQYPADMPGSGLEAAIEKMIQE
jgi:peroxiredoxin